MLFKDVSPEEQLEKFNEECAELYLEKPYTDKHKEELVDCLIAGTSYENMTGVDIISETYIVIKAMQYYDEETITKAINDKLEVNLKRNWKKEKGVYHHV